MTTQAGAPGLERLTEAPAKIWATINGASTRLPDGGRQLIGGWSEDADRHRAVEYVRADLAVLEATRPAGAVLPVSDAMREAVSRATYAFKVYAESLRGHHATRNEIADNLDVQARLLEAALTVQEPAPSPAAVVDEAMVERLTAEIAEARRRLAAWDINALPNDMSLLDIVDARIADLQKYMNGDDLPFRKRDIERGLILFRTSNNAHGLTNFVSLTTKVEALPQSGKDELASMMRNMAEQLSPALTESQNVRPYEGDEAALSPENGGA